jgi:hypothetical protein
MCAATYVYFCNTFIHAMVLRTFYLELLPDSCMKSLPRHYVLTIDLERLMKCSAIRKYPHLRQVFQLQHTHMFSGF